MPLKAITYLNLTHLNENQPFKLPFPPISSLQVNMFLHDTYPKKNQDITLGHRNPN